MFVARAAAMAIVASGLVAIIMVMTPFVGLRGHPRASLLAGCMGAAVAAAVVAIQVAAPLTQRGDLFIVADYFLAMAHRLVADAPYPFAWTPGWVYAVGSLTPLIPAGSVLALVAGHPARRAGARTAICTMVVGSCLILGYVAAAVYSTWVWWNGVLL